MDVHVGGKRTHERYLLMGQRVEVGFFSPFAAYVCMYGMVWYVWYGMVWYGMVWYVCISMYVSVCMYVCMVWYVWYGMVCMYGMVWYVYMYVWPSLLSIIVNFVLLCIVSYNFI